MHHGSVWFLTVTITKYMMPKTTAKYIDNKASAGSRQRYLTTLLISIELAKGVMEMYLVE